MHKYNAKGTNIMQASIKTLGILRGILRSFKTTPLHSAYLQEDNQTIIFLKKCNQATKLN